MCVWNDRMLREWAESGGVENFDPATINPASIDLRWSGRAMEMTDTGKWSDWKDGGIYLAMALHPGHLYLLDTIEVVHVPFNTSGILALKSSIGRRGIEHLHAGFFDPGFSGTATLEITNMGTTSIVIGQYQPLVQLVLYQMAEVPEKSYQITGRYNGQNSPQPAKA